MLWGDMCLHWCDNVGGTTVTGFYFSYSSGAKMRIFSDLSQIDVDRKYADVMELCFYNTVLTGMSLDGKSFTLREPTSF